MSAEHGRGIGGRASAFALRRRSQIRKPVARERRNGRRREPERERQNPGASAGMEDIAPIRRSARSSVVGREGERRAGRRIDERFAVRRAQAERADVGSLAGREGQLLEVGDVGSRRAPRGCGSARPARRSRRSPAARSLASGGRRRSWRRDRPPSATRQQEADERQPAELAVPAPRGVAANGLQERRSAAEAAREQRRPGDRRARACPSAATSDDDAAARRP